MSLPSVVRTGRWLALACGFLLGCGGHTVSESEPPGPVHEGMGKYALVIETLHDDCVPTFASGDVGDVVVVVATDLAADGHGGANIPVDAVPEGSQFQAARTDISFAKPLSFDLQSSSPGCSAQHHVEVTTLAASSAGIDVEWKETFTGSRACQADALPVKSDCTSDRIFHFQWLRACAPGTDIARCG
jgi:hypothetical protein